MVVQLHSEEERHSAAFIWASSTTALNAHKESWFWCACVFKNCTHCRKNFYLNLSVMTYKFLLNWCMHARSKRPAHYLKKSHLFATSFTSHPTVRSPSHLCMDRRISFHKQAHNSCFEPLLWRLSTLWSFAQCWNDCANSSHISHLNLVHHIRLTS